MTSLRWEFHQISMGAGGAIDEYGGGGRRGGNNGRYGASGGRKGAWTVSTWGESGHQRRERTRPKRKKIGGARRGRGIAN
jgi:hypothetical protein